MGISSRPDKYSSKAKAVSVKPEEVEDASGLLTEAEREKLIAEVEAELRKEQIAKAKVDFKDAVKLKARIEQGLEEEQIAVQIDLPGFSKDIRINNKPYTHGEIYTVPASVAETLMDMMARAWRHEEEVGGANHDVYRKRDRSGNRAQYASISAHGGVTNAPMAAPVMPAPPLTAMSAGRLQPPVRVTSTANLKG